MRRKDEERRIEEAKRSATLTVEGPMRHSKPGFEGVNDKCETLQQARKDPEAEVRSAALATQEPITYSTQFSFPCF